MTPLRTWLPCLALAACTLGLSACAYLTGSSAPPGPTAPCCGGGPQDLTAVYLGAGGWILEWDGEMVLGAPLFTNPSLLQVGLGSIRSDTARVAELLPVVRDARAILVGHAHYDHLLDVPWIARRAAPDAWVLGNLTTANILAGDPDLDQDRIHVLNHRLGSAFAEGEWLTLPGGRVRVMPLISEHAPHFQGIELFEGTVDLPMQRLPTASRDWVGGVGISYLIDFLDRAGAPAYRVYYSDISASAPWGLTPVPPDPDGRPVDLAILCAPSFHETDWYPEGIVERLDPATLLMGHWEDFFEPWSRNPNALRLNDFEVLTSRIARILDPGTPWTFPSPGDTLRILPRDRVRPRGPGGPPQG